MKLIGDNLKKKYINFWSKLWNIRSLIIYKKIEFNNSYFKELFKFRRYFIVVFFNVIILRVITTFTPIIITKIFENQVFYLFYYFIIIRATFLIIGWLSDFLESIGFASIEHSIIVSANKFFLEVDPKFHFSRESGQILSKVNRGAASASNLIDVIIYELFTLFVSVISTIILFLNYDFYLGLISSILIASIVFVHVLWNILHTTAFDAIRIKYSDKLNNVLFENLQQTIHIRKLLSTKTRFEEVSNASNTDSGYKAARSFASATIFDVIYMMYLFSLVVVGYIVIDSIQKGSLDIYVGIALIVTFFINTEALRAVGRLTRTLVEDLNNVKDLFKFIREFGTSTYPVLDPLDDHKTLEVKNALLTNEISVTVNNCNIGYNEAFVFNNLSFEVTKNRTDKNKLIGIIGPSGTGKTTIMAVLGAQIKPESGNVKINGVDIYSINDALRQTLIASQPQDSTAIRGSVRYNLNFSLDQGQIFDDETLIKILKNVGLWELFVKKDGLETLIGEGGITLSGGQRQRLNFANLYIRAKIYKPLVILIDEPTSSLDEISENAITKMIEELSENSLTFVVAHRLKTLNEASLIIDISDYAKSNKIIISRIDQLKKLSKYYDDLVNGKAILDNQPSDL
jgi:ATP-binding cassette subfamily B protein